MDKKQPEALRLANILRGIDARSHFANESLSSASAALENQHARITELESQLAQRFDAADVATAAAQGFRDGAAKEQQAGAFQAALGIRTAQGWKLGGDKAPVLYTDEINGQQVCRDDVWLCTTDAFTHPSPPEGMVMAPKVPTVEMKAAAVKYANGTAVYKNVKAEVLRIEEDIYGEVYEAMIAAAPGPADGESNG